MGCGNQFISVTYAPEPADAGDADHPLSSEINSPGKTESYRTEFGAAFGARGPACIGITLGKISLVTLVGQPTPDRTVSSYLNRITGFEFDDYTEGTFPFEFSCVITDEMTYQKKMEALLGALCVCDDVCYNRPDYFDCDDSYACGELYGFDGPDKDGMCYDSH